MKLQIRNNLQNSYSDIYTPEAMEALAVLSRFNADQKTVMSKRYQRRAERTRNKEKIAFLNADEFIPRTNIMVQDARDGKFIGSEIPHDLQRQWIQASGRSDLDAWYAAIANQPAIGRSTDL